ncbi:MAG: hypothetical protein JNM66_20530 [Bryobacterales bacterium]|nr:hypothetical protein [Bryobacterales bacterium]
MRAVRRSALPKGVLARMANRQAAVDREPGRVEAIWSGSRKTQPIRAVFRTLQGMMGGTEHCMYCVHSHGSDIEHFWPKSPYPERAFVWENLLLCCTECGRMKGSQFPLHNGRPLLVDPTVENPWHHLDFDPMTGNIVARFVEEAPSAKGVATATLLQLSRREALAIEYKKTWRRLCGLVEAGGARLVERLLEADDHGLLGWCFDGTGAGEAPFAAWRARDPEGWNACAERVRLL